MGGDCSNSIHAKDQYECLGDVAHPTFGDISLLRTLSKPGKVFKQLLARKMVTFKTLKQCKQYEQVLAAARSYENIPTLIPVYDYQQYGKASNGGGGDRAMLDGLTSCMKSYQIRFTFQYYEHSLSSVLKARKEKILAIKKKQAVNGNPFWVLPQDLKLDDYEAIDQLTHLDRKRANLYYQEVEVLRMIDHIVGGLYFLNHIGHRHQAVNPKNIMIDEEGKFILVDAEVFHLNTNYQQAVKEYTEKKYHQGKFNKKSSKENLHDTKIYNYLAPELLQHLKMTHSQHEQDSAKLEIFSVGMMALQLCLLDCFDSSQIVEQTSMRINRTQLNKALLFVRNKYSNQLVDLLKQMLEFDPIDRINYSILIDKLNPLLSGNLEKIQKIYSCQSDQNLSMSVASLSGRANQNDIYSVELMRKLADLEQRYQKILCGRTLYENHPKIDEAKIRQDQKSLLRKLKKIGNGKNEGKRQVRGSDLYEIYLNEYQSIKRNRHR